MKCRHCAEEILNDALICKYCGKRQAKSRTPVAIGLILATVFASLLLMSIVGITERQNSPSWESENQFGTRGRLIPEMERVPVCRKKDDLLEMSRVVNSKDTLSFAQMISGGRIFFVPGGSAVKVIDVDAYGMRKIRLMDGREGWVLARIIRP